MMAGPVRLQLSRHKGFDLQALSQATNGLPAVKVARPTKWGNPYKAMNDDAEGAVRRFRRLFDVKPSRLRHMILNICSGRPGFGEGALLDMKLALPELRGKNLACFCRLDQPCHADVLLELANRPVCDAPSPVREG
jgi:hypothetical protein